MLIATTCPNCLRPAGDYGDLAFQVPFYTSVMGVGDDPSAVYVESFNVETLDLQTPLMWEGWGWCAGRCFLESSWCEGMDLLSVAASTIAPSELDGKFQQTFCRSDPCLDCYVFVTGHSHATAIVYSLGIHLSKHSVGPKNVTNTQHSPPEPKTIFQQNLMDFLS